tara:strand:+ start:77 stop:307 length:231 start_codon:yes stop_codon:yes gene_type:complete
MVTITRKFNLKRFAEEYFIAYEIGDEDTCNELLVHFEDFYDDTTDDVHIGINNFYLKSDFVQSRPCVKRIFEYIMI